MINDFDTHAITKTARIGFLAACTEKVKHHFASHTATLGSIEKLTGEVWSWLSSRKPTCSEIYWGNNPKLMEQELLYHKTPVLLKAFHAVLNMHYYTLEKMFVTEYFESGGIEPSVGGDVFEVDETYFFNCVNGCIALSKDPAATQSWAEKTIARLQKEHMTANEDDHGRPVDMKYFQE